MRRVVDYSTGIEGYDRLPESIKQIYTPEEYLWLSDEQKRDIELTETEPDWDE
jgi:hypothetical protein